MTTESDFRPTAWHNLAPGDVIICPTTQLAERIVRNDPVRAGRRHILTNLHEHRHVSSMGSVRSYRPPALRRAYGTSPIRVGGFT